jgi:hypothetical protein
MPWYIEPCDRACAALLVDIIDCVDAVYYYDEVTRTFKAYFPHEDPLASNLSAISDGPGYWFLMNGDAELAVVGDLFPGGGGAPATYFIRATGFNLIGPRIGEDPMLCATWLSGLSYGMVLGFDSASNSYFIVDPQEDMVYPGQGYWVFFTATGERTQ